MPKDRRSRDAAEWTRSSRPKSNYDRPEFGPGKREAMPFGKYKGVGFRKIPTDYLLWLVGECDITRDVKAPVRAELGSRGVPIPARKPPP